MYEYLAVFNNSKVNKIINHKKNATYALFVHTFLVFLHANVRLNMAKNLLNKYVWLVETIYKAKQISFDDICKRWLDNDMSEGKPMSIRTFHKWRIAIEEMFGLIIDNEHNGQYRYYIQNEVV